MKTNNLTQHILIQLLNPGMYNDNILKSVLQEIEQSDVGEILSYRFNFQNLKPAVLPIQSEWMDKEFRDYFREFSKTHTLELSNGTIYDINLHNLAHIVLQTKNPIAKNVATQVLAILDKKLKKTKNKDSALDSIMIRNKRCNINVAIKPEDFYKKNFSPSYFSNFDSFAVNLLTNPKLLETYKISSDKKFINSFSKLIAENPERINDAVSLVNIATGNLAITLLGNKDLADKICREKAIEESFWHIITHNQTHLIEQASNYLKTVNKVFSGKEKTAFFDKIIQLPYAHFQTVYQCVNYYNVGLSLSAFDATDFIQKKSKELHLNTKTLTRLGVEQTQEVKNFGTFMLSMFKANITPTGKIEESLEYIESTLALFEHPQLQPVYQSLYYSNQKNLIAESIQKMLKSSQLDLKIIEQYESNFLRFVLLDAKIKKEIVSVMLEKGYYFKPTFSVNSKNYKLTGLKLSKENLIKNEKNLLGSHLVSPITTQENKNKFKI